QIIHKCLHRRDRVGGTRHTLRNLRDQSTQRAATLNAVCVHRISELSTQVVHNLGSLFCLLIEHLASRGQSLVGPANPKVWKCRTVISGPPWPRSQVVKPRFVLEPLAEIPSPSGRYCTS